MHLSSSLPHRNFSVFIFDKDGTLTPPNQPMTEEFASRFRDFLTKKQCVILTARDFAVFESQILTPLGEIGKRLILACSNGSEIYMHTGESWELVSKLAWNIHEQKESIQTAEEILRRHLSRDDVRFEFRSEWMGAFVCIPRDSSKEDRDTFDPDKQKRLEAIEKIRNLFPDSYEIIAGGQTSIDVSLSNKKHWLEHIIEYLDVEKKDIVYFGDSFENGNDTPILDIEDITTIAVENPEDTMNLLQYM